MSIKLDWLLTDNLEIIHDFIKFMLAQFGNFEIVLDIIVTTYKNISS